MQETIHFGFIEDENTRAAVLSGLAELLVIQDKATAERHFTRLMLRIDQYGGDFRTRELNYWIRTLRGMSGYYYSPVVALLRAERDKDVKNDKAA